MSGTERLARLLGFHPMKLAAQEAAEDLPGQLEGFWVDPEGNVIDEEEFVDKAFDALAELIEWRNEREEAFADAREVLDQAVFPTLFA